MRRLLLSIAFLCSALPVFGQCPLKQSTASQTINIGPFVDSTDGNTEKTALTIANTDIRIKKGGAAWVSKNSGGATHKEHGNYDITLDATDTSTVGILELDVHVSTGAYVFRTCFVYTAAVYDAFFGSSAQGYVTNAQVDVRQIVGSAVNTATAQLGVNTVSLASNAITGASIATDAVTKVQTGLYTFQKNVAGQKFTVLLYDSTTRLLKPGAASGTTCQISKDFAAFTGTNAAHPTDIGHGLYDIPATQAETNANYIFLYCTGAAVTEFPSLIVPQH